MINNFFIIVDIVLLKVIILGKSSLPYSKNYGEAIKFMSS